MCKSKTSVTKVTQSLISPYSLDTVLSQYQSFPSTNQTSSLRSIPICHSSPATDPFIGATHHRLHLHRHQHHSLIHLLEFFFFFPLSSIVVGPTVSWPLPPSLIHSFNFNSGFFFSFIAMWLYRFGFLDDLWVMGGWVCGLWWMVGMFCGFLWWLSCGSWVGS